ncbi:hypothetical protein PTNB73_05467 [Pyrenophora teres f. teres]|nr:hypothetical protein PTNB73_05467 [Pyrenophora teres f. teres]
MSKSALVFGASGVTGWSFINEILSDYPAKKVWKRAHALSNRPLSLSQSQWPEDPRLNMVSGIDLLGYDQETVEKEMQQKIPDISEVTHVYYFAYKAGMDVVKEQEEALDMFSKALKAVDKLCPNLEFVVLQIGTKYYGCHLKAMLPCPFSEVLFYHVQMDFIADYSKDKKWKYVVTIPDLIIGLVPNQNFYSLATTMGIYLSLWKEVYGEGAECPFPGTEKVWKALSNDSSSDMIARQTIHLTLSPDTPKGAMYNVADSKTPNSYVEKWPILCSYFGLKATAPRPDPIDIRGFIADNFEIWKKTEESYGLQKGHAQNDKALFLSEKLLMTKFDFDRHFDMSKIYSTGFTEERDTATTWYSVFDRMRKAKIIP